MNWNRIGHSLWVVAIGFCLHGVGTAQASSTPQGRIFALQKAESGFTLNAVALKDGEMRVFPGIIDLILPPGPGGSGSVVSLVPGRMLIARYANGEITVIEKTPGRKDYTRPAMSMNKLAGYDIRLCVISSTGEKQAFLISEYDEVFGDTTGPIIDIFNGMVPLKTNDYIVGTDTHSGLAGPSIRGSAHLDYDKYLFTSCGLPGNREADFIVDFGAASTVMSKTYLPPDADIQESLMVQYSAAGKQLLKSTPSGATGKIDVLGHTVLDTLRFGDLRFSNVTTQVISDITLFDRPVAGILGLDLLRRAGFLTLSFDAKDSSSAGIKLSDRAELNGRNAIETPFSIVRTHMMIKAMVNETPISFIFDTGCPKEMLLDRQAAKAAGIEIDESRSREARGLDMGAARSYTATAEKVGLGNIEFEAVDLEVAALNVFAPMRVHRQNVGLLGNPFFQRFKRIEIDFSNRVMRFEPM